MAYWIFKCNPKMYKLAERMGDARTNPAITWLVTNRKLRPKIQSGDTAFIMETGEKGGVRAVMRIDAAPAEMLDLDTERKYSDDIESGLNWRVAGTLIHWNLTISRDAMRARPGLSELSVFSPKVFQMATNFEVTPAEGIILQRMIDETG